MVGDRESFACQPNCRLEKLAPGKSSVSLVGHEESTNLTGDTDGQTAATAPCRDVDAVVVVQICPGGTGGTFAKVQRGRCLVGGMPQDHEPTAADAAGGRMDGADRQSCGDRGVNGTAAVFQDLCASGRGEGVFGCDHTRRCLRTRGGEQKGQDRDKPKKQHMGFYFRGIEKATPKRLRVWIVLRKTRDSGR